MYDNYQFGSSKAAIILIKLLQKPEYIKSQRNISAILHRYNTFINKVDISNLDDDSKKKIFSLWHREFKLILENKRKEIPCELKSYIINIATKNYRSAMNRAPDRNDFRRKMKKYEK